jgi:L-amino acid N-acyltransferase YncA
MSTIIPDGLKSSQYIIREARISDINRIIEIWKDGLGYSIGDLSKLETFDNSLIYKTFEQNILLQNENFKFWLYVQSDEKIISWCSILPFHPNPLLINAWGIMSMYIDSEFQNKIHGYYFSKFVLEEASKSTIRYILSIVASNNDRVIRLSKKMGFISLAELPHNMSDNQLVKTQFMLYES